MGKEAEEELQTVQENETKVLYDKIMRVAATYGKANHFAVIANKKQSLLADKDVETSDVTDEIITLLNEEP